MHSFVKEFHPLILDQLNTIPFDAKIVTPVYPNLNLLSVAETIDEFKKILTSDDKVIFITQADLNSAERHELFAYYKIYPSLDKNYNKLFNLRFDLNNIQQWNKDYKSFDDMQYWEKREYLSLIYSKLCFEFLHAKDQKDDNWLTITTNDILFNFKKTIKNIINYLGLTFIDDELDNFFNEWRVKQQYILDNYQLIEKIVDSVITGQKLHWGGLSLVAEALIQYKLKLVGFDIQCFNLNDFPDNAAQLRSFLIRTA
jgi:hypothetical protein